MTLAPNSLASIADTVLAARMKKPEFKEAFYGLARQRLATLRADTAWRVCADGVSNYDAQLAALRTLDALLSALPPDERQQVGGFVKLSSMQTGEDREREILKRISGLEQLFETASKQWADVKEARRQEKEKREERRQVAKTHHPKPDIANQPPVETDGMTSQRISQRKVRVLLLGLGLICADHIWELEILEVFGVGQRLTDLLAVCGLWTVCVILWNRQSLTRLKAKILSIFCR